MSLSMARSTLLLPFVLSLGCTVPMDDQGPGDSIGAKGDFFAPEEQVSATALETSGDAALRYSFPGDDTLVVRPNDRLSDLMSARDGLHVEQVYLSVSWSTSHRSTHTWKENEDIEPVELALRSGEERVEGPIELLVEVKFRYTNSLKMNAKHTARVAVEGEIDWDGAVEVPETAAWPLYVYVGDQGLPLDDWYFQIVTPSSEGPSFMDSERGPFDLNGGVELVALVEPAAAVRPHIKLRRTGALAEKEAVFNGPGVYLLLGTSPNLVKSEDGHVDTK